MIDMAETNSAGGSSGIGFPNKPTPSSDQVTEKVKDIAPESLANSRPEVPRGVRNLIQSFEKLNNPTGKDIASEPLANSRTEVRKVGKAVIQIFEKGSNPTGDVKQDHHKSFAVHDHDTVPPENGDTGVGYGELELKPKDSVSEVDNPHAEKNIRPGIVEERIRLFEQLATGYQSLAGVDFNEEPGSDERPGLDERHSSNDERHSSNYETTPLRVEGGVYVIPGKSDLEVDNAYDELELIPEESLPQAVNGYVDLELKDPNNNDSQSTTNP